jgi:hypothetical protein
MKGDGTGVDKSEPVKILDDVAMLYTEFTNVIYAIKNDKTVWVWGNGIFAPEMIASNVIAMRGIHGSPFFISPQGELMIIGKGYFRGIELQEDTPTVILNNVKDVVVGRNFTYIVFFDGTLEAFNGFDGIRSYQSITFDNLPGDLTKVIPYNDKFDDIVIILDNGECWGIGSNQLGELGDSTKIRRDNFIKIMDNVIDYGRSPGFNRGLLQSNGIYWEWSSNNPTPEVRAEDVIYFSNDGYLTSNGDFYTMRSGRYRVSVSGVKIP